MNRFASSMVIGTWKSFTIWMNPGSFSSPSSMVMKTTLSVIGTLENTVGSDALSLIGLAAGGAGAGANGLRPAYRCLIRSSSTEVAAVPGAPVGPVSGPGRRLLAERSAPQAAVKEASAARPAALPMKRRRDQGRATVFVTIAGAAA